MRLGGPHRRPGKCRYEKKNRPTLPCNRGSSLHHLGRSLVFNWDTPFKQKQIWPFPGPYLWYCNTVLYSFFGRVRKSTKSDYKIRHVCSSVLMEQLRSHWTDSHEIRYLSIFQRPAEKIQLSLKSDTNNWYFAWGPTHTFITSRSVLLRMRNVSDKNRRGNQNTRFVYSNFFLFEIRAVYEIMWKNTVERGRPQMTIWRMGIVCWITKATHTLTVCNTYCFHTEAMVARTRLNDTFICTLPVLFLTRVVLHGKLQRPQSFYLWMTQKTAHVASFLN
jgi:hypothetical protein